MNPRFLLILLLFCWSLPAAARLCDTMAIKGEKTWEMPGGSDWFSKRGSQVLYNRMRSREMPESMELNLDTGKTRLYSSAFDLTATPDQKFFVAPDPVRFYSLDEKQEPTNLVHSDDKLVGYYQSVGQLSAGSRTVYRVLTANNRGLIQDYELRATDDAAQALTPVYAKPAEVCGNLKRADLNLVTPMISQSGKIAAFSDADRQSTVIYQIHMPGGACIPLANGKINMRTSKVNFSKDDRYVVFAGGIEGLHKETKIPYYMGDVIYRLDLKTKEIKTISLPGERSNFAHVENNGDVYYTRGEGRQGSRTSLTFVPNDLGEGKPSSLNDFYSFIGSHFMAECTKYELEKSDYLRFIGLRLAASFCGQPFSRLKSDPSKLNGFPVAELEKGCQQHVATPNSASEKASSPSNTAL